MYSEPSGFYIENIYYEGESLFKKTYRSILESWAKSKENSLIKFLNKELPICQSTFYRIKKRDPTVKRSTMFEILETLGYNPIW